MALFLATPDKVGWYGTEVDATAENVRRHHALAVKQDESSVDTQITQVDDAERYVTLAEISGERPNSHNASGPSISHLYFGSRRTRVLCSGGLSLLIL